VRAEEYTWTADQLFIARKRTVASVFEHDDNLISSSAYPVPATESLNIEYRSISGMPVMLSVFSSDGRPVCVPASYPAAGKIRLDTRALAPGLYLYRLSRCFAGKTVTGTGRFLVSH
jgi:hypothetical protein